MRGLLLTHEGGLTHHYSTTTQKALLLAATILSFDNGNT